MQPMRCGGMLAPFGYQIVAINIGKGISAIGHTGPAPAGKRDDRWCQCFNLSRLLRYIPRRTVKVIVCPSFARPELLEETKPAGRESWLPRCKALTVRKVRLIIDMITIFSLPRLAPLASWAPACKPIPRAVRDV